MTDGRNGHQCHCHLRHHHQCHCHHLLHNLWKLLASSEFNSICTPAPLFSNSGSWYERVVRFPSLTRARIANGKAPVMALVRTIKWNFCFGRRCLIYRRVAVHAIQRPCLAVAGWQYQMIYRFVNITCSVMIDCSVYMTVSQSKSEQHVTVGCNPAFDLGNKDAEEIWFLKAFICHCNVSSIDNHQR